MQDYIIRGVVALVFVAYPSYWLLSNIFTAFLPKSKKIYIRGGPFVTPNTEFNEFGFSNRKEYLKTYIFQQLFALGITILIVIAIVLEIDIL